MPEPDETIDVTIRVAASFQARLDEVVSALNDAGLTDVDVHRRFLMISGSIASAQLPQLSKIDGVSSVRPARKFRAI
jgi:hypothetical protein